MGDVWAWRALFYAACFAVGWWLAGRVERRRRRVEGVRVQVLDLGPNDLIVLSTDTDVSEEEARLLKQAWTAATKMPTDRVVVLSNVKVDIIRDHGRRAS